MRMTAAEVSSEAQFFADFLAWCERNGQDIGYAQESEYRLAVERFHCAKRTYGAMIHDDTRPKALEFGVPTERAEQIEREVEREWNRADWQDRDALIFAGIMRVAAAVTIVADPNGDNPRCKNLLFTMTCERCGRDMREPLASACPGVVPSKRWRFA